MGSYWTAPARLPGSAPPTPGNTNDGSEQYSEQLYSAEGGSNEQAKGTDSTFHVSDLLRRMTTEVAMDPLYKGQWREELEGVPGGFLIHNVLSADECREWIAASEASPLSILAGSFQYSQRTTSTKEIRDSSRVLCDVPDQYISLLEDRIARFLPESVTVSGAQWLLRKKPLNERWRFNKYAAGQRFAPHFDAGYTRSIDESTQLTIIIYLNEDFTNGETIFFPGGKPFAWSAANSTREVVVTPKIGLCLIFFHNGALSPRHEGAPHTSKGAYKYIIRSDIVYQRAIPL